jgi:hypothetical protein
MGFQNYGWPWKDNDFFQELWLQLAASGVGQFYYLCAPCPPSLTDCGDCGACVLGGVASDCRFRKQRLNLLGNLV